MRKYRLFGGVFLTLIAFLLIAIALSRTPRRPDFLDSTRAAAYSNLLAVASQITGELDSTNRAAFVAQNKSALALAHSAIQNPIESPESSYRLANFDMARFGRFKKLAYALVAEGQVAEDQKRYRDAANIYRDTLRFGERVEHGPMINYLVGAAIERTGLKPLEPLLPKLSTSDLAELAPDLQSFNHNRITFDEILDREDYFMVVNATNIIDAVKTRFSRRSRKMVNTSSESHLNLRAQIEITAATMATLQYARENQSPPTNLASLAPKYLKTIPIDPYSNQPLLLITSTNAPVIYSVGPNRRDDHARFDDIVPAFRDTTASRIMLNAITSQ